MPSFSETKILNYTARQVYDLVIDVERYPEFVPWCSKCRIIETNESDIIAELEVKFGPFNKSYISKISHGHIDDAYFINISQISGPFENLDTKWKFEKNGKFSTKIYFSINFNFSSKILSKMISSVFELATKDMVNAFEDRAKEIYGNNQ